MNTGRSCTTTSNQKGAEVATTTALLEDSESLAQRERRWPALARCIMGAPAPAFDAKFDGVDEESRSDERELGFVMSSEETIQKIVRSIHDGRNIMLVGPRGTGKSHMARNAVKR